MRTLLMVLTALLFATVGRSALTTWSASLKTTTGYEGGSAYLLEVSNGGPTLTEMINYVKTSGLTDPGTGLINVLATATLDASSQYFTSSLNSTVTSGSSYYTLFVDASRQNFAFSVEGTYANNILMNGATGPDGQTSLEAYFDETISDNWALNGGTIGGGSTPDPSVPEPTVLALLALGVAGLALKRKHF